MRGEREEGTGGSLFLLVPFFLHQNRSAPMKDGCLFLVCFNNVSGERHAAFKACFFFREGVRRWQ